MHIVERLQGPSNEKFLIELHDGARIESVLYRGDTLCISSQVGCGVGCPFCASGANGVGRNLSEAELDGQLALVRSELAPRAQAEPSIEHADAIVGRIARVTISGAGEPLHNYDVVARFVTKMHLEGTPASLTSTGMPQHRLPELLANPFHNGVTLSVHAGREATRARLVPKGGRLDALFARLCEIVPTLPTRRRKKLALAYLAIEGENDTEEELEAFAARALPLGLRVHLYAHNAVPTSPLRGVSRARYEAIYAYLRAAGLSVHMSSQARIEATGGCGTLVAIRSRPAPVQQSG